MLHVFKLGLKNDGFNKVYNNMNLKLLETMHKTSHQMTNDYDLPGINFWKLKINVPATKHPFEVVDSWCQMPISTHL